MSKKPESDENLFSLKMKRRLNEIIFDSDLTKEEFAKYVQEYRNVLPHTKAYIIDAFNLPCKNIIKILVEAEAKNSSADYTNFLTAIKEVFLIAKQNQFKSLACDLKTLSNIDPALTEIVKREIKNNKKIKILKNN